MNATATSSGGRAAVPDGTDLAVLNTRLALDRTQLAWVRTGFTFITAGIAIDKVTEALHAARLLTHHAWVRGSHVTGLILVSGSTLVLLLAAVGYVRAARELPTRYGGGLSFSAAVLAVTGLLVLTGVLLTVLALTTHL